MLNKDEKDVKEKAKSKLVVLNSKRSVSIDKKKKN